MAPTAGPLQLDVALLLGNDPYAYPDNLPIVAAKGGPGGKPGCGSLPDATKNFPVRELVTNTGWGTGLDIRPNPGLGHPCWADYFPVTRAVPQAALDPPVHSRAGDRAEPRRVRRTARRCTDPAECRCGQGCRRPRRRPSPVQHRRREPERDSPSTSRRRTMQENLRGVVRAPRHFPDGLPADRRLAGCRLRTGPFRPTAKRTTPSSPTCPTSGRASWSASPGVEVGKVEKITINPDATVRVEFTADNSVTLTAGNPGGDPLRQPVRRPLPGARRRRRRAAASLSPGQTIPLARTKPALDLDCPDRRFQTAVSCAEPRAGQRAERAATANVSGAGPHDRVISGSGRGRDQHPWPTAISSSGKWSTTSTWCWVHLGAKATGWTKR